jgi:two-component system OmpR family response regulator
MNSSKGRILCTEDDPDTRELIILTLNFAGYEVICTDDPRRTLELIKAEKFDLCLMDNWMPGISGDNLCKKIREFDSKTPILFYSGAAYQEDKDRARAAGAQGYLVKPVRESALVAEVARIISESKISVPIAVVPPGESRR